MYIIFLKRVGNVAQFWPSTRASTRIDKFEIVCTISGYFELTNKSKIKLQY